MSQRESLREDQLAAQAIDVQYFEHPRRYEHDGLPVYFDASDGHTSEEAIERMAAVVAGNVRVAQEWMDRPNGGLQLRTPRQAYRDGDGERVIGILANIAGF